MGEALSRTIVLMDVVGSMSPLFTKAKATISGFVEWKKFYKLTMSHKIALK